MNLPAIVKLRFFFLLSTIIYTLWGLSAFVVTIILGLISSCIPYFILWSVFLLFNGLINTFTVVMFKSVNECNRLKHMVHFTFFVNTIGFLLTAVGSNSKLAMMHPDWLHSPLNTVLTSYLQWLLVFIFIMTTLQNMWTIAMVYKLEKIIKQIQIQTVVRSWIICSSISCVTEEKEINYCLFSLLENFKSSMEKFPSERAMDSWLDVFSAKNHQLLVE